MMTAKQQLRILFVLLLLPGAILAQESGDPEPETPVLVGPARLDLNIRAGDQNQRQTFTKPEAGANITVDVAVTEGAMDRTCFDIVVTYDADQILFQAAEPVDLFEGAYLLPSLEPGRINIAGLLLDSDTDRASGSLAQITFIVLGDLPEASPISLNAALLGSALAIDSIGVGTETSIVRLGGDRPAIEQGNPDFNGDGSVGFTDFVIFAGGFGAAAGNQSYNPALDLDGSGNVGFSDFLIFAQAFGT